MKLIAGMHRSGTSLVARIFFEAGADMGDPTTFYNPDRWNPDGYFEQADILSMNMPLIHGPFWKLSYFFLPAEATILRRARRRSKQIREVAARYQGKVVKENRFSLTLPAWIEHGCEAEKLLVVLREPAAVANSLRRRNHISLGRAHSLWYDHNRRLLDTAERYRIAHRFVLYGNLLDPDRQVPEALSALRFFGLVQTPGEVVNILQSVVRPALNHHSKVSAEEEYPRHVRELWNRLAEAHSKQSQNFAASLHPFAEEVTP